MGNEFPGSPYVIQEFSATVRGQTKLLGEGKPQGENRQAPEPPDMPREGMEQGDQREKAGDGLRRKRLVFT
jgi:hypothetical protein